MSLRSRLHLEAEPVYLMDGSAFIFRSFYAFRNMSRSDGFPTNALYMVARLILKLVREEKPRSLAFIMDGKGPNFRHERFAEYKAQRPPTPEPLVQQLEPLKELLSLLGVPVFVSQGCEADDCIAALAGRLRDIRPVIIVGADKDLKQCLHENVVLWDPAAKDEKITTLEDFTRETGLEPASWPDYQALVGDSSDNIPGVPQIGPKGAGELMREFGSLEQLFDRLNAVPPKMRPKLEGQREKAMLYRELTRLDLNACPEIEEKDLDLQAVSLPPLVEFMSRFELRSLAREVESMSRAGFLRGNGPVATTAAAKASPFSAPPRRPKAADAAPARAAGLLTGAESGPRAVPPVPEALAAPARAEQGSLFTPAQAQADNFAAASTVAELPLADASLVALLPLSGKLLVAAGGREVLYTGPYEALTSALAGAAARTVAGAGDSAVAEALSGQGLLLVTPDYKALYKESPAFRDLPAAAFFDLSLAAYLLGPEDRGYSFSHIAARWGEASGSAHSPTDHPGLLALDLCAYMHEQLAGARLTEIFRQMEMPLAPVLARMEERGIRIDRGAFASFLDDVQAELQGLTAHIQGMAGKPFNIRSSQQLADVLFVELGLPLSGKTKGGAPSTSDEALEKLSGKHDIVALVQQYRKLEKLRSTYLEPLPALAGPDSRIHTTFNQTATATGRLSSSNPNLQNIPVRGDFGRRMRACFVAAKGMRIVSADYSQVELRVLAHLSGDPTLLEAFRNNQDIHSRTAGLLFDVPLAEVTPDMRRNAKTINFGLVYGMGAQKLAQELHIGMKEAKAFIERYFERLARLKEFYESVEAEAKENGFVETMAGRRRMTPDILSQNNQLRSQARRQAINTRIQGSAADIIKLAMLAVEEDEELKKLGARLLLQIHDELLLEAPEDAAELAGERLAALMAAVNPGKEPLSVPLLVDWGVGSTWADAH